MVGKKKKREGGREDVVVEHYSETNYRCILHSFTLTGIVKTHQLGYQECEALQAVFTKDLSPNHIAGPARYKGHTPMWNLSLGLLLLHLN